VYAHEVTNPGPRSGSTSGTVGAAGPDATDPGVRAEDGTLGDQSAEDEQPCEWYGAIEKMYGWEFGEYEIGHDGDGDDRYDDEYEHEDFFDQLYT